MPARSIVDHTSSRSSGSAPRTRDHLFEVSPCLFLRIEPMLRARDRRDQTSSIDRHARMNIVPEPVVPLPLNWTVKSELSPNR